VKVLVVRTGALFGQDETSYYATELCEAVARAGHAVEMTTIPFAAAIADVVPQTAAYRLLDLRQRSDACIALGPFSWAVRHHNKRAWVFSRYSPLQSHWGTAYGAVTASPTNHIIRNYVDRLERTCLEECEHVFAASDTVAEALRSSGVAARVLRAPLPTHLLAAPPPPARGRYLLAAGRIRDEARLDLLIRAIGVTRAADVRLVIAGRGASLEEIEYLQALIGECGNGAAIELDTEAAEADLPALIAGSLALASLSFADDSPDACALFAASLGKPVLVARDSGDLARLLNSDGWVVDPSPASVASAVDRLFDNGSGVARAGDAPAKRFAKQLPAWTDVVSELLA
jgi:glycosyltransferase involved in cell wall biosynthesis